MLKISLRQRLFLGFVMLTILVMTLVPMPSMMPSLRPAGAMGGMAGMAGMSMAPGAMDSGAGLCSSSAMPHPSGTATKGGQHPPADCDDIPMHCMFCSSVVDPVTPSISSAVLVLLLTYASAYLPALFEHGPRTLFMWAPSQARAPPSAHQG